MDEDTNKKLQGVKNVLRNVVSETPVDPINPDAQEVYDNILLGNGVAACDIKFLVEHGVSHLLNCAAPPDPSASHDLATLHKQLTSVSPDLATLHKQLTSVSPDLATLHKQLTSVSPDLAILHRNHIKYLGLQLSDDSEEDISKKFEESGEWIDKALGDGGKVLVNCKAGMSRSSTIVLAFLMRYRGMLLAQAVRQVKSAREIKPNKNFLRQLLELDKKLSKECLGN